MTEQQWRDSLDEDEVELICGVIDRTHSGTTEDWFRPEDIRERIERTRDGMTERGLQVAAGIVERMPTGATP